jgi:hypothetical protein
MATDVLEELTKLGDAGLRELLASMARSSRRIAAGKLWAGSNPLGTPAGIEDFVAATIESVLGGDRPWSRSDGHSFRQHVFMALKSEIDNLATWKDNVAREVLSEQVEHKALDPSPEALLASRRFAEAASQELAVAAGEYNILQGIADLFLEGYDSPEDFAAILKKPKESINAALQKLRRRLDVSGALPRLKEMM